jgi:hypothetical protein
MNPHLTRLKSNLESADDAMRRHPSGGTPNRSWVGEQLMLIRLIEEAGFVSGEWDGLFVGLLDDLGIQQRHLDRHAEIVIDKAKSGSMTEFMAASAGFNDTNARFEKSCADFIRKFGGRITLKE